MNCEPCDLQLRPATQVFSRLCEQCRAGAPSRYVLLFSFGGNPWTPYLSGREVGPICDAMDSLRQRRLPYRLLAWQSHDTTYRPLEIYFG